MHDDDELEVDVDQYAADPSDYPIQWTHWAQLAALVSADILSALAKGAWTVAELVHIHQEYKQNRMDWYEAAQYELEALVAPAEEEEVEADG